MSLAEDLERPNTVDETAHRRRVLRVLLVWDAPNLDMGLGAIIGGRPSAENRPRFDALGR